MKGINLNLYYFCCGFLLQSNSKMISLYYYYYQIFAWTTLNTNPQTTDGIRCLVLDVVMGEYN